jgi:hypothetical protein
MVRAVGLVVVSESDGGHHGGLFVVASVSVDLCRCQSSIAFQRFELDGLVYGKSRCSQKAQE